MMEKICKTICKVIGHDFISDPEVCDRCGELKLQLELREALIDKKKNTMSD